MGKLADSVSRLLQGNYDTDDLDDVIEEVWEQMTEDQRRDFLVDYVSKDELEEAYLAAEQKEADEAPEDGEPLPDEAELEAKIAAMQASIERAQANKP